MAFRGMLLIAGLGLGISSAAVAQEYRWNLFNIGVVPTLHESYSTGDNVKIAVLDGLADLNHFDLAGRVDAYGYASGVYTRYSPHGTHVSGIVGAGIGNGGIAGVAPGASIANYAVFDDSRWLATDLGRSALVHARSIGVTVVNMSYGPTRRGDIFLSGELDLFKSFSDSMVFVRAAGNDGSYAKTEQFDGDASAELGHLLIVGSVDQSNEISSFSTRPGNACIGRHHCAEDDRMRNFWLVAPGESIVSDAPGNNLATMSGTSMAAPHVTGAVALLQSYWPHLKEDPAGTAGILKMTATDLGAPGVDAVYGWGLLNVEQAFQPVGLPYVATETEVGEGGVPLSRSFLTSTSTVPGLRAATAALSGMVVFDDFGRDFATEVPEPPAEPTRRSIDDRLDDLLLAFEQVPASGTGEPADSIAFHVAGDRAEGFNVLTWRGESAGVEFGSGNARRYFETTARSPATSAGQGVSEHLLLGLNEAGRAFEEGTFANLSLAVTDKVSFAALYASGDDIAVEGTAHTPAAIRGHETPDARLIGFETSYQASDLVRLALAWGSLREKDRFLGATNTGAFSLGEGAVTQIFGVDIAFKLSERTTAAFFYDHALVGARAGSNSLYDDVDGWRGRKFGASLSFNRIATQRDRLHLTLMQPLHIRAGAATAKVPVGRRMNGGVVYEKRRFEVNSDTMPLDLGLTYLDRGPWMTKGISLSLDDADARDLDGIGVNLVAAVKISF